MKIECILKRSGGTHVEIGGMSYHFKPRPDGAHIAEVDDRDHIGRFLSIPEGYRIAGSEPASAPAHVPAPEPVEPVPEPLPESDPPYEPPPPDDPAFEQPATEAADGYDAMERDALVDIYVERFGTKPPGRIGKPAIIAALREQA